MYISFPDAEYPDRSSKSLHKCWNSYSVSHSKNVQFPSVMSWVGPRAIVDVAEKGNKTSLLNKETPDP